MKRQIEQLLVEHKLTSAQFADIIGVQRSSISHIISGRNKPSYDFIQKILLKYPDINANWLITGNGDMFTLKQPSEPSIGSETNTDLFNQPTNNQEFKPKHTISPKPQVTSVNTYRETSSDNEKTAEVTNVNKEKSLIIIYDDDTFKVLNSR